MRIPMLRILSLKSGWRSIFILFALSVFILPLIKIYLNRSGVHQSSHPVAVVFGAAVKGSGQLFGAILYRTNTAIYLYKKGVINKIIFSGSDKGYQKLGEAEAMRVHARRHGVPDTDIILDREGHDTLETIQHSYTILQKNPELRKNWNQALFISQDYHLARIRMIARRFGFQGFIYPAHNEQPLNKENYFVFREIFAYLHDLMLAWPFRKHNLINKRQSTRSLFHPGSKAGAYIPEKSKKMQYAQILKNHPSAILDLIYDLEG